MTVIKGSYRNPNEGYDMAVSKGSIRKPPIENPAYEMAWTKGSIRRPPKNEPLGIEATYIKGSVRKPPVVDYTIPYEPARKEAAEIGLEKRVQEG